MPKFGTVRRLAAAAVLLGWALAMAVGPAAAGEPLKVGFVYVGPVSDHGWSYQHDQGRKAAQAEVGDRVVTTVVESVGEGADAERVLEELVASGHRLIFATSFGFMNAVVKVAARHPEVRFEHATGYKRAANLATYNSRFYEGRAVVGLIVAGMTKSNIIGYIGSYPIPEVISGINAFTLALRRLNPKAEVRVVWVNSWYDPGKEADAAKVLIDQGADIILQHTDSPAAVQIAEQRGVWAVGQSSDMARFGPKAVLTSIVDEWDVYYTARMLAALNGNWTGGDTWGGLKDRMLYLTAYNSAIPKVVVDIAEQARREIVAGSRHPFAGPIRNQQHKEMVASGQVLPDRGILSMDWFVDGVVGSVPK